MTPRNLRRLALTAIVCTPMLTWVCVSWAGDDGPADQTEEVEKAKKKQLQELEQKLNSGEPKQMIEALKQIAKDGFAEAAPLVATVLSGGAPKDVLLQAMKTSRKLKLEALSAPLSAYVRHRNQDLRREAARALIATGGPAAVTALQGALRSQDPVVRGTAASGLGTLGARNAIDDLFQAYGHNVAEAAAAIGQLCKPEQCEKFAESLGKAPFDVVTSGFDQILFRPQADMPDEQKIRIIGRLRELGTSEAGRYLVDVQGRWPKAWNNRVKQVLDAAVKAVAGGGS